MPGRLVSIIWVLACWLFVGHGVNAQTLPPGPQVLTFFSDIDDSEQPYCIYIPQNFSESKAYPLVVMLHGAGSNHRLAMRRVFGKSNVEGENDVEASLYFPDWKGVDMIVAAPYARGTAGYQGIVEKDVMDMITDVKSRFRIDENRIYLTGLSMGGGGTLWIGLSHPDMWAAIAPVCPAPPPGTNALAPNALNMAVRFVHGAADPVVPADISREWVAALSGLQTPHVEYEELPGVDHWSWVQAYEGGRIFEWFSQFERNPFPHHVRHAAIDLNHGASYWIRIDQKSAGETGYLDAQFVSINQMIVRTSGLIAFTLMIGDHPMVKAGSNLQLQIDEAHLELKPGDKSYAFCRDSSDAWVHRQYQPARVVKSAALEGPMYNAFASRHVYVYGTADDPSEDELRSRIDTAFKAADWSAYRGEFLGRMKVFPRIIADKDVRPSDHENANLILFGTQETNSLIQQMANTLPLHLDEKAVKNHGLAYVFPNAHGNLVVVNSGLPWWHVDVNASWRFLPQPQSTLEKLQDYILFSKDRQTFVQGYFDERWGLKAEQQTELESTKAVMCTSTGPIPMKE